MIMPRIINFLTTKVKIDLVAELNHEDDEGHASAAWGIFDPHDISITMQKGLSFSRERSTFLHENLHLIFGVGGMDEVTSEEQLVTRMTPILLSWMRENPRAVAYLLEKS